MIVAVDGPAGSGKGTVTKRIEKELGFLNLDTGATYRCVTLAAIQNGYTLENEEKIVGLLDKIKIEFKKVKEQDRIILNDVDVTDQIRSAEVNNMVSQVSHIPEVRNKMADFQRKIAEGKNVIMEGRDIGTNVFPNANVKIYLDATAEERAKRRVLQNKEKGIEISYQEVLENIKFRDNNDKTSKVAPLKMAEDAIYVDSTDLNINEVVEKIVEIIKNNI